MDRQGRFQQAERRGEQELLRAASIPELSKRDDISSLCVTGVAFVQTLRVAARNTAMSASEMRTRRPGSRCTGSAPDSMRRRTVRGDTLKTSAASSIVRSLVIGRRVPVEEAGLRCGLEFRWVMFPPHLPGSFRARKRCGAPSRAIFQISLLMGWRISWRAASAPSRSRSRRQSRSASGEMICRPPTLMVRGAFWDFFNL
jgi:hypothetical protein